MNPITEAIKKDLKENKKMMESIGKRVGEIEQRTAKKIFEEIKDKMSGFCCCGDCIDKFFGVEDDDIEELMKKWGISSE